MTAVAWRAATVGLWVAVGWGAPARAATEHAPAGERTGPAVFRLDLSDAQREQLTEAKREELIAQLETLVRRFPDDSAQQAGSALPARRGLLGEEQGAPTRRDRGRG